MVIIYLSIIKELYFNSYKLLSLYMTRYDIALNLEPPAEDPSIFTVPVDLSEVNRKNLKQFEVRMAPPRFFEISRVSDPADTLVPGTDPVDSVRPVARARSLIVLNDLIELVDLHVQIGEMVYVRNREWLLINDNGYWRHATMEEQVRIGFPRTYLTPQYMPQKNG